MVLLSISTYLGGVIINEMRAYNKAKNKVIPTHNYLSGLLPFFN